MTPKSIKHRQIDKFKYAIYQKKATDFYQGALDALQRENWNSVGLESIHCVISTVDMLTVYSKGIRCASPDHYDSIEFLGQVMSLPETKEQVSRVRDILSKKNLVEYEDRNFTKKEAVDILKKSERFLNWARKLIKL